MRFTIATLFSWLLSLSLAAKIILAMSFLISLDSLRMAWGEKRFIAGFFESFVAISFYWLPVIGIVSAIAIGGNTFDKSGSKIKSWTIGLLVLAGFIGVHELGKSLPGVGWRIHAMQVAHDEEEMSY